MGSFSFCHRMVFASIVAPLMKGGDIMSEAIVAILAMIVICFLAFMYLIIDERREDRKDRHKEKEGKGNGKREVEKQ